MLLTTRLSATEHVVWRTELPGSGHASIIVCEDKLFTVAAVAETEERLLLCLDRKTGKILWQPNLKLAFGGAPVAYEVNGTEYIAVAVGGSVTAPQTAPGLDREAAQVGQS